MAKRKGKKARERARLWATRNQQRQAGHDAPNNQNDSRDQIQAPHANMTPDDASEASLRGGLLELAVDRGKFTFNPSTINAHDEGDQDVTLLDISPAKTGDAYNPLFGEVSTVEAHGINIFKVQTEPLRLSTENAETDPDTQRSLEDVFTENPGSRLSGLDAETLAFAGQVVRQVVLEATYDFLQRCIPRGEQHKVWDSIRGQDDGKPDAKYSIAIPEGTMDLKNGVRSVSQLLGNCIDILSQNNQVTDQKTLKLYLGRAVTLCDALSNEEKKQALAKAADELDWLILGLDCKTMELYRVANRQLDKVNMSCPIAAEQNGENAEGVHVVRRCEERNMLQSMQRSHGEVKEKFRIRFIEALQSLLAL
ncbi:hypothetical protein KVR01_003878 [Diaporthe batatas]|uniref:uncharacterized protein n=1 Tax=Diaporthe batatas TaxID=748121 RepID=UPI001D0568E8|nr:uncharacterized protein KVR01_003878 [Diaporthe batatas]KAG8168189.1 hypothetical protein KVR01_003878 [Diaporthe batatas]